MSALSGSEGTTDGSVSGTNESSEGSAGGNTIEQPVQPGVQSVQYSAVLIPDWTIDIKEDILGTGRFSNLW